MKPHIKIKIRQGVAIAPLPHWQELLEDRMIANTHLHPHIDSLLAKYDLPVWATQEYRPAAKDWDAAELASGLDRIYRLILQQERAIPDRLIEELSHVPIVEEVQIGAIAQADLPKLLPQQRRTTTDEGSRRAISLEEAHIYLEEAQRYTQSNQSDPPIKVAVLDTGITLSHPELQDALLPGYDFVDIIDGAGKFVGDYLGYDDIPDDEVGHGTHVAGIIAAKGINMPLGVVPKCKILPVRVLGAMEQGGKRVGAGLVDNINSGIKWAIDKGANVINMSLGIQHTGGKLPHQEVVDYAQQKGVTIVAASGNSGNNQLYYPGALPYVITVGAFDERGKVTHFSTYGKQVVLTAPGTNIYSTYLDNKYGFSTGTSHASPFVAGAVALLKSYSLKKRGFILSDSQIKHILKHSSDKFDTRFKSHKGGFGKLNLRDALGLLDYQLNK
ncbi:S8 family peptidase [Calothrix sp. FACHB-1219]|uniref:S8 family peptidase n=1 Tax=unclassified Calothrix TaxID=2619626 RepID=UPI001681DDBB|nr:MULTISPECIES: S8 family peptidase [unclassified Calothrix]MBD2208051.1 S8 family peptidase [Calothrix sp. FACHB-168]MBD2221432.1 S8 family peptidase [Calothrix sp. FACHB-1219]